MRIVRRGECLTRAWKNGRGVSHRIACWPAESAPAWEVSLAEIDADAPFSEYAGIDRHFVIVAGGAVALDIDADGTRFTQVVQLLGEPFAFRGEWPVRCRLLDGAAQALNVLTRRGDIGAAVSVGRADTMTVLRKHADEQRAVFFPQGAVTAYGSWGTAAMQPGDSIVMDEREWNEIALAPTKGPGAAYVEARLAAP